MGLVYNKQNGKLEVKLFEKEKEVLNSQKEVKELTRRISCNPESHGVTKFITLSSCGCLAAELFIRDYTIAELEKENGVLRKEKLLRFEKK